MGEIIYKDSSLEKCLETASLELQIPLNKLQYKIIEDKKGIFKRIVTISVNVENNVGDSFPTEGQGTIKVVNGKIIIKDPIDEQEPALIVPSKNAKVFIDGVEVTTKKPVYEHSIIEIIFDENVASRNMNIMVSEDKFEAYVTIRYVSQIVYGLKDTVELHALEVEAEVKEKKLPPVYTVNEIKEQLKIKNVVYGIIEENLEKCTDLQGVEKMIVAKGIKVINDEDDRIEIKANNSVESKHLSPDEKGRVDFKSIGFVQGVKPGDVLAIVHKGNPGQDGIDVLGKAIEHKKGLKLKFTAGGGCEIQNETIIVSQIEGKPCIKNNSFFVYKVHELQGDVDISTGDIKFIGDVNILGSVKEGMKVEAGNSIEIAKDVERATISAIGNITINGSVLTSTVSAGGQDVKSIKQIDNLNSLKTQLSSLMETVEQIKKFSLLGSDVMDGEAIKVLIENKFKQIPKTCLAIIACSDASRGVQESELISLIKTKLTGLGPLSIKNYSEVNEIIELIHDNIENLNYTLTLPVKVKISYCQESSITSSGDIVFTGSGEYVSNIVANGGIYFENPQSVARGGELKAKNEIKCKKVGSTGGVNTKLIVEKDGHVWADVAYQNTQIIIGLRKYDIEYPCKDVHGYLDQNGDIVVESLKL